MILYGSWVNGTPTEYRDIDLAIFSPDFGKHKLKELLSDIPQAQYLKHLAEFFLHLLGYKHSLGITYPRFLR